MQSNDLCISFRTTAGPRSERTRRRRRSLSTWLQPSPRRGDVTAAGSSPVSTPSPPRSAGKGVVSHGGVLLARGVTTPEQEQDRFVHALSTHVLAILAGVGIWFLRVWFGVWVFPNSSPEAWI